MSLLVVIGHSGKWEIEPAAAAQIEHAAEDRLVQPPVDADYQGLDSEHPFVSATRPSSPLIPAPGSASTTPADQFNPDELGFAQSLVPSQIRPPVPVLDAVIVDALTAGFAPDVTRWFWPLWQHLPPTELHRGLCVMSGESNGRPAAHNTAETEAWGGSAGLFQVAVDNVAGKYRVAGLEGEPRRTMGEALALLLDPFENIRISALMWQAEGWLPAWTAQKSRCELTT